MSGAPLNHNFYFHIAGCFGNTPILSGSNGSLAIQPYQYEETMNCRWKIVVDARKVGYFWNVFECVHMCACIPCSRLLLHCVLVCALNVLLPQRILILI